MPAFSVVKPVYLAGGLGVTATGVAGATLWGVYGSGHGPIPPGITWDEIKNRWKNPLTAPRLNVENDPAPVTKQDDKVDRFKFQENHCFTTFFPGAGPIKHEHHATTETRQENAEGVVAKLESGFGQSVNPAGCAMMQMSYTPHHNNFIFKAEVTVKSEDVGWALWAGARSSKVTGHTDTTSSDRAAYLQYRLMFLRKDAQKDTWSISGGILWFDLVFEGGYGYGINMHIGTPKGEIWWNNTVDSENEMGNQNIKKEYVGMWEASGKGKEVFKDIAVYTWKDQNSASKDNADILGRGKDKFHECPETYGYRDVTVKYVKDKGWVTEVKKNEDTDKEWDGHNMGEVMDSWYAPFKDKKGEWKDIKSYCDEKTRNKSGSGVVPEVIRRFCYQGQ